jgi:Bacterial extracellular solute-binding protein
VLDETSVTGPDAANGRRRHRFLSRAEVLLCGTGTHKRGSRLKNIPSVKATLTDLADVLVDRCGARKPTVETDPKTLSDLGAAISAAARRADEVLIIYYVGHGMVDPEGQLHLAAAQTDPRPDAIEHTALSYATVRRYVRNSPAALKIVILDCCYSGIAVGNLGSGDDIGQRAAIDGAYVLTSAGDEASIAPPGARHTAFSGELIKLLEKGDPRGEPEITLDSMYAYLVRVLGAAGYPRPRRRVIGVADQFVLADNVAYHGSDARPKRPSLPPPRRRIRVPIVVSAVLAGAAAAPVLDSFLHGSGTWLPIGVRGEVLRTWWGVLLLVTTAALVALFIAGPTAHWITRVAVRSPWRSLRRLRVSLLGLMAFALVALLGVLALTAGASARVALATCPTSPMVSVLAPAGSLAPTQELAQAYERETAADNFGCPVARLLVYAASALEINAAMAAGWGDEKHVQIGPAPDVWLPDWSGEVRQATADATAAGRTLPVSGARTIASTPVVLAAPTEADLADGTALRSMIDILRAGGWNAAVPDPSTSVGALARIPLYRRTVDDKTTAEYLARLSEMEHHLDQSLDAGKFALGSDATALLCADGRVRGRTAYVVTEQDLARFNDGSSCGHQARLRAVYAADTPVLDRQAVQFAWPQTSERRTRAAALFADWLTGPTGKEALAAAELRPVGASLGPQWGLQPDVSPRPAVVSVDLVDDVRAKYQRAHRYGRVLVAIDASGSMGVATTGGSPWQVAVRDVAKASDGVGSRDLLGVWVFQGTTVRKPVPPAAGPRRVGPALRGIKPGGPAPLFAAVAGAVNAVGPSTGERVTAVIVLTDGEGDNASAINAGQFRAAVEGKGVRVFAVAMGTTGCAAPVLKTITAATAGKCLEAEPGSVAEPLETIFGAVL